jgi:hypothetical protein
MGMGEGMINQLSKNVDMQLRKILPFDSSVISSSGARADVDIFLMDPAGETRTDIGTVSIQVPAGALPGGFDGLATHIIPEKTPEPRATINNNIFGGKTTVMEFWYRTEFVPPGGGQNIKLLSDAVFTITVKKEFIKNFDSIKDSLGVFTFEPSTGKWVSVPASFSFSDDSVTFTFSRKEAGFYTLVGPASAWAAELGSSGLQGQPKPGQPGVTGTRPKMPAGNVSATKPVLTPIKQIAPTKIVPAPEKKQPAVVKPQPVRVAKPQQTTQPLSIWDRFKSIFSSAKSTK